MVITHPLLSFATDVGCEDEEVPLLLFVACCFGANVERSGEVVEVKCTIASPGGGMALFVVPPAGKVFTGDVTLAVETTGMGTFGLPVLRVGGKGGACFSVVVLFKVFCGRIYKKMNVEFS